MPRVQAALRLWDVQRGVVSKGEDGEWEQAGSEPLALRFAGGGVLAALAEKLATGLEWLEGALGDSEGLRHQTRRAADLRKAPNWRICVPLAQGAPHMEQYASWIRDKIRDKMVYRYMGRHDAAWLAKVEAHVREAKAGEALRRHGPARRREGARGGRGGCERGMAAREGRGERLRAGAAGHRGPLGCLNCVRLVLCRARAGRR